MASMPETAGPKATGEVRVEAQDPQRQKARLERPRQELLRRGELLKHPLHRSRQQQEAWEPKDPPP